MIAPTHERLQRHEVMAWLLDEGLKARMIAKLIANKIILGAPLFKGGRNIYSRTQIQRDVLDKHTAACNSHCASRR